MIIRRGQSVLLTGASGGLGVHIARAIAKYGLRVVLTAYPGIGLDNLKKEVEGCGSEAISLALDLRDTAQRVELISAVAKAFDSVDILINNAGIEYTSAYHDLSRGQLREILAVNLEAPMLLAREFIPGMLERKCGHIVNISSLAGKSGPAYQEPYAATKAALIAFTTCLRATYRGTGVSASVITPGFVEAGIYARLKEKTGCSVSALLGSSRPEKVADAVIRAIERDRPEIIVNPIPVRPLFALTAMLPSFGAWVANQLGANDFFRQVVEAQKRRL